MLPQLFSATRFFGIVDKATVTKYLKEQPLNCKIVDVRNPDETAQGVIDPQVITLPLPDLVKQPSLFKEIVSTDKTEKIIFYCRSGARSAQAASIVENMGYTNVHNYEGSWLDWSES